MVRFSQATPFALVVLLSGCSPVTEADLVGNWIITEESLRFLPEEYRQPGELVLEPQGDFKAIQLPGELFGRNQPVSGQGNWGLVEEYSGAGQTLWQEHRTVRLSLRGVVEGHSLQPTSYGTVVFVHSLDGEPTLFYYSDDPDLNRIIYFSRDD